MTDLMERARAVFAREERQEVARLALAHLRTELADGRGEIADYLRVPASVVLEVVNTARPLARPRASRRPRRAAARRTAAGDGDGEPARRGYRLAAGRRA